MTNWSTSASVTSRPRNRTLAATRHTHDMTLHASLSRAARAGLAAARTASSLAQRGGACGERRAAPASAPCGPRAAPASAPCGPRTAPASAPCGPRAAPVSAPCEPAPPPPCRARSPAVRRGVRVLCCAPASGTPPPCPRTPPSCPLTYQTTVHGQNYVSSRQARLAHIHSSRTQLSNYSCDQDPVARRLQLARSVRRAHYEWQVACRAAACPAPSSNPSPYTLSGERECARATDGCTYAVVSEPSARLVPERCGPCRSPPPPRCVELAPDNACRIKSNEHLDPCAHRPRVILEIDRSCVSSSTCAPSCGAGASTLGCGSSSPCANGVELLRTRPLACPSNRRTHTSVTLFQFGKSLTPVCGGLEGMLRSKEQLKEAGLGRVVTDAGACTASPRELPEGRLELSVPPGAARVAVHVSLSGPEPSSTSASCSPSCVLRNSVSCANLGATSVGKNPWLPTEKIQKKWASSVDLKASAQSTGARCPGPCSPCGQPTPPRCKPGPVQSPNQSKIKTKRFSSISAFLANTIV